MILIVFKNPLRRSVGLPTSSPQAWLRISLKGMRKAALVQSVFQLDTNGSAAYLWQFPSWDVPARRDGVTGSRLFCCRLISRSVTFPVLQCLYAVEKSCEGRLLWKSHCCLSSSLIFPLWESVPCWQVNYCKQELNHDHCNCLCPFRLDGRDIVLRNHYWGSAFSEALTAVWWVVSLAIWLNAEFALL